MAGDDDEGFGDFKFAPPNPTFNSNPVMMNGHHFSAANNDDDDWGDFINPGGLSHTISLPRFPKHLDPIGLSTDQKVKNEDSEPSQPGSAPARVLSGMAQWKKPTGALPLSIFGELEEEEESGAGDPSFGDDGAGFFCSKNVDSVKKGSGANVNDLIFNSYKPSDSKIESSPDLNRSNSVEKMNKNEKDSNVNINVLSLGAIEQNSNSHGPDFSWNRVNSNTNGKVEQTLNSPGFNLDWDPLNLNPNGLNSNRDVIEEGKSSANEVNLSFENGSGSFVNGDDDGWEFKDAQAKSPEGEEISETIRIMTENGPVSNLNGFNLTWNSLSLDLNDWNSNSNGLNSNKDVTKDEKFDNGDDDEWEFKDAQPKTPEGEEISKTNQIKIENVPGSNLNGLNSTWNSLSFKLNGWNSNSNGMNSNKDVTEEVKSIAKGDKWGFVDDNERIHIGNDDEWEFKDARPKTPVVEEISKTNQIIENRPVSNFNGFNSTWNSLSFDLNGSNSNSSGLISNKDVSKEVKSIAKGDKLGSRDGNEWEFNNGDDAEWEFKDAQPKTPIVEEISKTNQIKTGNGPVSNLNGLNSTWNSLSFDLNGWDSNLNSVSSSTNCSNTGPVHQNREHAADDDDDGWEFKVGDSRTQDGESTFGFGNGVYGPGHLFGASQRPSQKLGESNSEFDFSSNQIKQNNTENKFLFSPVDEKLGSVENSWAFKDAFSEAEPEDKEENKVAEVSSAVEALVFDGEVQGNKVEMDNNKRALPLSIFGDEEEEADDPVIYQEVSTQMPTSDPRNVIKKPQVDINDLISSLYSQAVQTTSVNHEQTLSESGLDSTSICIDFNLASDDHDFDDSWEFQDASASLGTRDENVLDLGESPTKYATKTELNDYVEYFSKLREESHYIALYHLENLKKARSAASLSDSDAKIQSIDKEIQDLKSEMQDNITSSEVCSENRSPGKICLNVFVEVLQEPKFQVFASEYQLTKKLSLAESDWRSTIELLKCVAQIVNILTSVSREEQSNYISAWSKMLFVCAQEIRHGAFIWKQAVQENIQNQILSKPQGKKYVLALGEIYRVVEVLGSSAKLYKPWILASSADSMFIFTLISECSSLWSSSGLEEALQSILNSADFEYYGSLKTLLESIKFVNDLDVHALYNYVFSGQSPTCQLSALTAGLVPGMKTVAWNGKHCFLTLANLWANLISCYPPNLPCINGS